MLAVHQMSDFDARPAPAEFNPARELARFCKGAATFVALANYGLVLGLMITGRHLPGKPGWPEAFLLFTGTLATLAALSQHLPMQNTLMAAGIIGGIGAVAHLLGAYTAIPFGPFRFTEAIGPLVLDRVAWAVPFLWVFLILNARGVARLILRPWRKVRAYGFWLIGLTVGLTVLFEAALEPFAVLVKKYWLWEPTRLPITWGTAPLTNFVGWLVTALLVMAFAAPTLIDKRPRAGGRPPDYHPLITALLLLALFAIGLGRQGFWWPAGYCLVLGVSVSCFAVRGARW